MFQSHQTKDNSDKKNENIVKKTPGVDYAQMMQMQTEQSRSDLATQMKENPPAQFMVEEPSFAVASEGKEEELQAKLNDHAPIQMQEEEEEEILQAKLSDNAPVQFQEEEEEMLQAKLNSPYPVQMQEEPSFAKASEGREEELQAKLSNNVPGQMQEEEEEVQAKLNSSNPVQMQEEPSFADRVPPSALAVAQASEGKEEMLQAKSKSNPAQMKEGSANSIASASNGTSTSLPKDVNAKMENSFGTSFTGVNIHKNSDKATQLGALAYTQGNDVHFAPGQYNPASTKGQELIGHELTHVVQQRAGRVNGTQNKGGMNVNTDKSLENEADVMGARAAAGKGVDVVGVGSGIQRTPDNRIIIKTKHANGDVIMRGNKIIYITAVYTNPGDDYVGKNADTLWSISQRCGTTVTRIKELNPGLKGLTQGESIVVCEGDECKKWEKVLINEEKSDDKENTKDIEEKKDIKLTVAVDREAKLPSVGYLLFGQVGHTWIQIEEKDGTKNSYGFYPETRLPSYKPATIVDGKVKSPDDIHTPNARLSTMVSAKQLLKGKKLAEIRDKGKYNLYVYNCTTFAKEFFKLVSGIEIPSFGIKMENPNVLRLIIKKIIAMRNRDIMGNKVAD